MADQAGPAGAKLPPPIRDAADRHAMPAGNRRAALRPPAIRMPPPPSRRMTLMTGAAVAALWLLLLPTLPVAQQGEGERAVRG